LVGLDENIVLDCYRLAKWYSVNPEVFLNMPLNDVQLHLQRTIQLAKVMRQEAENADDG
jgi:hypothetical protein